jgi:hypothetical protein
MQPWQYVSTTIEEMMGVSHVGFEPIWDSRAQTHKGVYATVDDMIVRRHIMVPGDDHFDACCELLASLREAHPREGNAAVYGVDGIRGLELYADWVRAKADEALGLAAEKLASMRAMA